MCIYGIRYTLINFYESNAYAFAIKREMKLLPNKSCAQLVALCKTILFYAYSPITINFHFYALTVFRGVMYSAKFISKPQRCVVTQYNIINTSPYNKLD